MRTSVATKARTSRGDAKRCPTCGRSQDDLPPEFVDVFLRAFLLVLRECRRTIAWRLGKEMPPSLEGDASAPKIIASTAAKKRRRRESAGSARRARSRRGLPLED